MSVWLDVVRMAKRPGQSSGPIPHDAMSFQIRATATATGVSNALCYAERRDAFVTFRGGAKPRLAGGGFDLWRDQSRRQSLGSVRRERGTGNAEFTYGIYAASGESLGILSRRKAALLPSRRARWILQPIGSEAMEARKGQVLAWWVWLLLSPIMGLIFLVALFAGADGLGARPPRRLTWRRSGQAVLDFRPMRSTYHYPAEVLRPELVFALVLVHSQDSGHDVAWLA